MATGYIKQTWIDGDITKPFSAARLGVIENGIFDAHYRPSVAVLASAALSIPNAAATVITFNTESFDTDNMHSTVSNTGRLVAPVAGKYHISGRCGFAANATGARQLVIRINGSAVIDQDFDYAPTASGVCSLRCFTDYALAASDYVELVATQTSGGALNTSTTTDVHFQMHLVSY